MLASNMQNAWARLLEEKKHNSQLFPIRLHQQGSNCLTEEVRIMGSEMHCLQDKREGGVIIPFSLLTKTHRSLLALSYHQMFGDPRRHPVARRHLTVLQGVSMVSCSGLTGQTSGWGRCQAGGHLVRVSDGVVQVNVVFPSAACALRGPWAMLPS